MNGEPAPCEKRGQVPSRTIPAPATADGQLPGLPCRPIQQGVRAASLCHFTSGLVQTAPSRAPRLKSRRPLRPGPCIQAAGSVLRDGAVVRRAAPLPSPLGNHRPELASGMSAFQQFRRHRSGSSCSGRPCRTGLSFPLPCECMVRLPLGPPRSSACNRHRRPAMSTCMPLPFRRGGSPTLSPGVSRHLLP